jgi:hypothetical protein
VAAIAVVFNKVSGPKSSEPTQTELAAIGLLVAFSDGREPLANDIETVDAALSHYVRKRFGLPDSSDVAAEAIALFLEHAVAAGHSVEVPIAYLYKIAFNVAQRVADSERLRLGVGGAPRLEEELQDERFGLSVDRISASKDIRDALAAAARGPLGGRPDAMAVRVLATFLDLAEHGEDTSTRAIGRSAGCSHSTVERVYNQVAIFLDSDRRRWPART